MSATFLQPALLKALTTVAKAVNKRATLPVLSNVRADVHDSTMTLYATDLSIGIELRVPGVGDDIAPFTVNAADLLAFVKAAPKDRLIELGRPSDTKLLVASGITTITLSTIDAEEFPVIPDQVNFAPIGTFAGDTFKRACERARLSAATDESRPILTGVLTTADDRGLTLVSADNYRISETVLPWYDRDTPASTTSVIPAASLAIWAKIAPKDEYVDLAIGPTHSMISLSAGDIRLISRTIPGQFPNYTQVIPTNLQTTTLFDPQTAAKALAAVLPTAAKGANVVKLYVNGAVDISATYEHDTAMTSFPADTDGPDGSASFNGRYLKDAFASLGTIAKLQMNDGLSPILLTSLDPGDTYRMVVMPVRTPA